MMNPAADPAIPPGIRAEIEARLHALSIEEDVRILLAIESGSRAWGFPSPDSDYDIRFVYVRRRNWYLQLQPGRDVIERPIEDEIDLNGWDIRKALSLLLKSNAVISEWMESPVRYCADHPIIARLRALADDVIDSRALAHHYARLGSNAAERWLDGDADVAVKKYFYALRPALVIRALRLAPEIRPPMHLAALIRAARLPEDIVTDIATLVEAKQRTNERSDGAKLPRLDAIIRSELGRAADVPGRADASSMALQRADDIFLELVNT
ncbi:nucleotidyltransferase domain-containing protein [Sphingomonas sp. ASY06-1R]|uniref:nucleotidyltransferase domain-containing protein n=1 Tax=Sphingomonas sp. ASY06-1R TaxID=3445771 RepID=UPI003FA1B3A5